MSEMKYVLVNAASGTREEVAKYLPTNFRLIGITFPSDYYPEGEYIVVGKNVAGWTVNEYVIPRLGSGLIAAREVWMEELMEVAEDYL